MTTLIGGSGCIVKVVGDKVIKYATSEPALLKLREQLEYLLANQDSNPQLPKVLDYGSNYYVMPRYYGYTLGATPDILKVYQSIQSRSTQNNIDFSIHDYFCSKVYKLLNSGDVYPSDDFLYDLTDYKITGFHGDITRENTIVLPNNSGYMLVDPNPSKYQSYGLEMGKFLFSVTYGYEELKCGEPSIGIELEGTSVEDHFYAATHFIRVLPYNNNEVFRNKYNEIMWKVLYRTYTNKSLYIFDFDGVLVNSDRLNIAGYSYAMGKDITTEYYKYKGLSYKESIPLMMGVNNLTDREVDCIHKAKISYYKKNLNQIDINTRVLNFYIQMVTESKAVIYSCASPECVESVLHLRGIPCKKVFYTSNKHNTQIFKDMGVVKEDCIMVDDSRSNMDFYNKEHVDYIGVKS